MSEPNQSRVVLKGEIHTSESDLVEERELLVEGVDALVLEGQQEDAEYGLLRSWYATAMSIIGLILFETFYTDHSILVDLADAQDARVVNTRESDSKLVENANPVVEIVAAILFYGIFIGSVFYGLFTEDTLSGALLLLGAALFPVYILRRHAMNRSANELNRDMIIADRVAKAAEEVDRVVAVIGADHVDSVAKKLPDGINPEKRRPAYGFYSWQHAKEIGTPAFKALSILFVLYWIILELFQWIFALT